MSPNHGTRMMRGPGGKFRHILEHFQDLQARGSPRGYFPEPTKIILVMALRNVARVEEFFCGMAMTIVTRSWYFAALAETGRLREAGLLRWYRGGRSW